LRQAGGVLVLMPLFGDHGGVPVLALPFKDHGGVVVLTRWRGVLGDRDELACRRMSMRRRGEWQRGYR
jgi:hypothetical protein